MKLLDDFYKIEREDGAGDAREYAISLNEDHFIYRAHFPGAPVTPGACIIQLCKELMERHAGARLALKRVINVKFLSVIDPVQCPVVQVAFSKIAPADGGYRCSALVYREATTFAKLSLFLQIIDDEALDAR